MDDAEIANGREAPPSQITDIEVMLLFPTAYSYLIIAYLSDMCRPESGLCYIIL